jgi:hypothetical protein
MQGHTVVPTALGRSLADFESYLNAGAPARA